MYRVKASPSVIGQAQQAGILPDEFDAVLDNVLRIAQLENPRADWTVSSIRCTDGNWQRVKCPPATWRAIIEINDGAKVITLHMILRRSPETYLTVERAWEEKTASARF
jgi:hypothetical protein